VGGIVHTVKKNTILVSIGSKEAGQEMDGDKYKNMIIFGQSIILIFI